MNPRILKLVQGVHMGLGHDGLRELLKKNKIDVSTLMQGELIMCMNKKGDKLKVVGFGGIVIGYLKMPKGDQIMKEALQYIPQAFGSEGFDYNKACRKALENRL